MAGQVPYGNGDLPDNFIPLPVADNDNADDGQPTNNEIPREPLDTADLEAQAWTWIAENGFGLLWDVLSHCCLFIYFRPSREVQMMLEHPLYFMLQLGTSNAVGLLCARFGLPGIILNRKMKLGSSTFGILLWFLSFFFCLATDAEFLQFMRARCPEDPLPCFPFMVIPERIHDIFSVYGPLSMVLFPLRLIYNHFKHNADGSMLFFTKLFLLVTIDVWLYVFCKYRDQRYNDSTKALVDDTGGALVAKCTLTILNRVLIPGVKSIVCLFVLFFVTAFSVGILQVVAVPALRFVQRRRAWFRGHAHLD